VLPIWRRKNILAVWWLRFSTFVMIYSTAMSLVYYENTRRWMVRCYKGLIHSGGLVTFRYGTFTMLLAQLWVLLVMNTQRWMVRCYEDYLLASLWFSDFHVKLLSVHAIHMIWIVHAMPQTRGVSPFSQTGFGIPLLNDMDLCLASLHLGPLLKGPIL